jgi:integrase
MSETDLANGSFLKIPCIEKWVLQLRGRGAKDKAINMFLGHLKYICMGKLPNPRKRRKEGKPSIILEDWGLKHPASLTLKDCLKYNSAMIENEVDTRNYRLAMRNFLKSRNIEGCDTISGKLEKEKGQYAHLYTNKTNEFFAWLKDFNYEVYLISKFAFKCGGVRKTASLNAEAQYVDVENKTIILFEKSNRNAPKRKVIKEIPDDLFEELLPRIKVGGKLFNISDKDLCKILRACYKAVIPELEPNIPMPFHFWRHQFAQHMLRATDWNYALVALYGDWKVQTLEDYYGAMDKREVRGFAREKLAEI